MPNHDLPVKTSPNCKRGSFTRRDFLIKGGVGIPLLMSLSSGTPSLGEERQGPLIVALMGDPQWGMTPATPQNVQTAMEDINTLDCAFMAVLGDCVQNRASLFSDYLEHVVNRTSKPVYSLPGNGDLGAGLDAYSKATGFPLYYSITVQGIRFLFTGTVKTTGTHRHICWMGDQQLVWLKKELMSDIETTTLIFSHPPVFETTWHSEERDQQMAPGSMYLGESEEMRVLLNRYSNIVVFAHGHLHHRFGVTDECGRGDYHQENQVLHISVGATANGQGSRYLYIDREGIRVKARDHETGMWRDDLERELIVNTTHKSKVRSTR